MKAFKYFFRSEPEGIYFENYGKSHFLMLFILIIGLTYIYINRDRLSKSKNYRLIKRTIGITLLAQQGILYLWYLFTGFSSIKESLPLYNCRVAIICTALGLLTDKKVFKNIAIYWGVYGGILALAVVEGDPFVFPHYTRVSFFLGHIFLLWGTFFMLLVDKYQLSRENLISTLRLTTVYHLILLIFNFAIDANYDYLIEPPILKDLASQLPQALYSFIAIILFDIFIFLFHTITLGLRNHRIKKQSKKPLAGFHI